LFILGDILSNALLTLSRKEKLNLLKPTEFNDIVAMNATLLVLIAKLKQ